MQKIIAERRANPRDDLLSDSPLATNSTGQMDDANLVITMILLLIAGHETTVNLITNGTLTLLRYPAEMEWSRDHPERAPIVAEEVCASNRRCSSLPASHWPTSRSATTIPRGRGIRPILAAGKSVIQSGSHTPTASIPIVPTTSTSASAAAFTSACCNAGPNRGTDELAALARQLVNPRLPKTATVPAECGPARPRHLLVEFDQLQR